MTADPAPPSNDIRHLKCGCVDQKAGNGQWRPFVLCAKHATGRKMSDVT